MNGFEFMSVLDMKNIYTCMEVKYFNTYNDTIMKKKCLNAHIEKKNLDEYSYFQMYKIIIYCFLENNLLYILYKLTPLRALLSESFVIGIYDTINFKHIINLNLTKFIS